MHRAPQSAVYIRPLYGIGETPDIDRTVVNVTQHAVLKDGAFYARVTKIKQ